MTTVGRGRAGIGAAMHLVVAWAGAAATAGTVGAVDIHAEPSFEAVIAVQRSSTAAGTAERAFMAVIALRRSFTVADTAGAAVAVLDTAADMAVVEVAAADTRAASVSLTLSSIGHRRPQ